jgi:hypothetical protein
MTDMKKNKRIRELEQMLAEAEKTKVPPAVQVSRDGVPDKKRDPGATGV